MSDDGPVGAAGKAKPGDEAEARKERQAAALRENLRRRNAQRREREQALRDALERLRPNQREVIELHWFEGLPFAEVAKITGASLSAVKVRAHRAYEALRGILDPGT